MLDAKEPDLTAGDRLREAHADWIRKGSPKPTAQAAKRVVDAYAKLDAEITTLEMRVERLKRERSLAIIEIVRVCGRGRLDLGPRLGVQIPMAKGNALWMRPEQTATARKVF